MISPTNRDKLPLHNRESSHEMNADDCNETSNAGRKSSGKRNNTPNKTRQQNHSLYRHLPPKNAQQQNQQMHQPQHLHLQLQQEHEQYTDHISQEQQQERKKKPSAHTLPNSSNFDSPTNHSLNSLTSNNSRSNSSSRTTILVFLAFVGFAIIHAIARGFESMHNAKLVNGSTTQQSQGGQGTVVGADGYLEGYQSIIGETDDAAAFSNLNDLANNEVAYDNRNVNANPTATTSTPTTTATLLSRASQLSSLISNLDASDVVEVYVVTRMAPLMNVISSFPVSASGGAVDPGGEGEGGDVIPRVNGNKSHRKVIDDNMAASNAEGKGDGAATAASATAATSTNMPMGQIQIRKSALAFRHRPRVALATRFPHSSAGVPSSTNVENLSPADLIEQQKYFELTLEYGPQRTGATKTSESMPLIHIDTELMGQSNSYNNINGDSNDYYNIGKYVSWENEARIYHSTHISNEWTEAYYMAPITGVVLEKIIQRAVDYTNKRPRYQPFEVVSIPSQNLILKSSGSDDFVWDMFRDLADLYVDIDPILVPPRGKVQFYVSDPETRADEQQGGGLRESGDGGTGGNSGANTLQTKRREPNPNVKRVKGTLEGSRAATFYENMFNCANAIKTGDYSMYLPPATAPPTSSPTPNLTTPPSSMPSLAQAGDLDAIEGNDDSNEGNIDSNDAGSGESENVLTEGIGVDLDLDNDDHGATNSSDSTQMTKIGENMTTFNVTELSEDNSEKSSVNDGTHADEALSDEGYLRNNLTIDENNDDDQANNTNTRRYRVLYLRKGQTKRKMDEDSSVLDDEVSNTEVQTTNEWENDDDVILMDSSESIEGDVVADNDNDGDTAEAAEKAAIAAAQAAQNAAAVAATNSSQADSAAAASEAAKAAQKAADTTVAARAKSSSEGLLSGDGALMTSILSSCFSDPKYGIRKQEVVSKDSDAKVADDDDIVIGEDDDESAKVVETIESTYAYIYLDGEMFFRLNLTAPYWSTASVLQTVPPPHIPPEGKGDAVDWAIFVLILMGTLFGFLVMIHQVGIIIDRRLKFQWFFNPTSCNVEEDNYSDDGGEKSCMLKRGGGFPHSIGIDAIPTSMGGQKSHYNKEIRNTTRDVPSKEAFRHVTEISSPDHNMRSGTKPCETYDDLQDDAGTLNLEMSPLSPTDKSTTEKAEFRAHESELPVSLRIKRDTPDLVERPSLKSMSKVAFPHISPTCDKKSHLTYDDTNNRVPLPFDYIPELS